MQLFQTKITKCNSKHNYIRFQPELQDMPFLQNFQFNIKEIHEKLYYKLCILGDIILYLHIVM